MTGLVQDTRLTAFRTAVVTRLREHHASQAALAGHVGITAKHMSQILRGKASPGPELLDKIAAAMGLQVTIAVIGDPVPLAKDKRGRKAGTAAQPPGLEGRAS